MIPGEMPPIDNPPDAFARIYASPLTSLMPIDTSEMVNAEACNSWTESGVHSPTVSTARLAVPGKASNEYQKACGAYKDKKLPVAEEHVRKAIAVYPNYVAAWVVLGQVLDAQHKRDDARTACSQASAVDPNYVAPYLCLAEFAATENNWDEVSKLSQRALALDPVNNVYSLYYAADAGVHLLHLADAETKALAAIQLDTWHHLPQLHLLMAQVYAAKGDVRSEMTSLKQYLKLAPNSSDARGAKDTLAQLEVRPAK
jgi:tetratricopeptide (TPR) repeat protein